MSLKTEILIALILWSPLLLRAEEYSYTGSEIESLMDDPNVMESQVGYGGIWYCGASLLETMPLMEDVYLMDIQSDSGNRRLEGDDLAEFWGESYWIRRGGGISLLFGGELFDHVGSLGFEGTPLRADELEIWLSWEGIDELKEEIGRFAGKHDLKIRTVEVPHPEAKLVSVVRARGEVPDLVMVQSGAVESLVGSRAVQSLDYLRLPSLIDQGVRAFSLNDRVWAVPFYFDTQVVFYNKALFTPPPEGEWTLEAMENAARSVTGRGVYPLVWNAYSSNWLLPFQIAFGKEALLNRDGTMTVDDEPTEKALDYIIGLIDEGLLTPMERDGMDALFIAGKIGMIMSGSYAIPYFESLGIDFAVLPYPRNERTGINLSPLLDFKAFCMTRRTDSPLLARRVLQYLAGPGVQQRFCPPLAKLPARRDVLGIPGIPYGYLDVLDETVETGSVIPPQRIYGIYKNNMWKLIRFALSGRMSVRQTLEQGQILMDNTMRNEKE
jgi:ABC-type glycerol-3-phosphate transport system substrate-binding protein